tara:strand:- start:896 stop:1078 length:183 start_codon:yes stop_codon:yes gene_type:complete
MKMMLSEWDKIKEYGEKINAETRAKRKIKPSINMVCRSCNELMKSDEVCRYDNRYCIGCL